MNLKAYYYPNTYHIPIPLRVLAFTALERGPSSKAWTELEQELGRPVKHIQPSYGDVFFYEDMYR